MGAAPDSDEDSWAVLCLRLHGSNRFKLADSYANALKQVDGLKPGLVQVYHEEGQTGIYYGRYQRRFDAKTGQESFRPDHLKDIDLIRHLSMTILDPGVGTRVVWPFQLATMGTLPGGRGSHPAWRLRKASGYYSLQVAVFYNSGEMRRRKFAAEEYCKLLREQGEQAYYHHGHINSSVCIGAFPEEAIQTRQKRDPLTGIIVVEELIVDERLLALQKKHPHNLHNGAVFYELLQDPKTGRMIREAHTSFAVEIPRQGDEKNPFTGTP